MNSINVKKIEIIVKDLLSSTKKAVSFRVNMMIMS